MNIQSLMYFASAAKHLSFTKAAEECLIAQTAMSRQIVMIENEIGAKLFFRSNKGVKLTPAGEAFFLETAKILKLYHNAVFLTRDIDSSYNETLSIGFGMFDIPIVSAKVKAFAAQNPNVSITLNQYTYDFLNRNLKEGICDIAICPKNRTLNLSGINTATVQNADMAIAVGNMNPLSRKKEITPEDLQQQVFINPVEDRSLHPEIWSMFCERMGITPKKIITANTLHSILILVNAGFGVAFLPYFVRETTAYDISYVPLIKDGEPVSRVHVAVSLVSNMNKAAKKFMKMNF